jgi:hypothetical protein
MEAVPDLLLSRSLISAARILTDLVPVLPERHVRSIRVESRTVDLDDRRSVGRSLRCEAQNKHTCRCHGAQGDTGRVPSAGAVEWSAEGAN